MQKLIASCQIPSEVSSMPRSKPPNELIVAIYCLSVSSRKNTILMSLHEINLATQSTFDPEIVSVDATYQGSLHSLKANIEHITDISLLWNTFDGSIYRFQGIALHW
jgi:hypothetical protein